MKKFQINNEINIINLYKENLNNFLIKYESILSQLKINVPKFNILGKKLLENK